MDVDFNFECKSVKNDDLSEGRTSKKVSDEKLAEGRRRRRIEDLLLCQEFGICESELNA